jgi:spermidine synthase
VVLAESHLAVHTWPETQAVTLDLYVCNFSQDNSSAARNACRRLISAFAPARVVDANWNEDCRTWPGRSTPRRK